MEILLHSLDFIKCFADYGGISASRLEVLEEKLKADVISELNAFGGRHAMFLPALRMLFPLIRA